MNITIDTSAIIAVVGNEKSKPRLVEVTTGHTLIAPISVHWEIGNALSAMLKRNRISLRQARSCIHAYQQIPIKFIDVDLTQALDMSARFSLYAYDAYLLICASQANSPLLTLDKGLKSAAADSGIITLEV
jgi:predicted nucleic acid-binding protein